MLIIPAIDLKDGNCVRLRQGRLDDDTLFSTDPVQMAEHWQAEGARYLHLVDLNGAFAGHPVNREVIAAIVRTLTIPCQLGGGIRSLAIIEDYLNLGLDRIILGTAAVEQEDLVAEAARLFPGRICVGIDARQGMVATRGWAEETELKAVDLARKMQDLGVAAIIYTDIMRDGMQTGVNVEETGRLAAALEIPVIASGGIASLADLEQLLTVEAQGVVGAITGRAIYEGTLNLREAVALTEG
ncbi:MAG: 1-(5-phosphoribosyl)-5-[(5-phosphoribosylamino)methylideneamino]imidazole-4-carboxamide isomerase [Deltaproteobacteria bacterium]|nr:1-(5-phosphoribosyl)-5-[(5-phosphoribosylamino)methylideneamino]imidazole-4-carboxamide isomerase [Candidatus Anaeroferrophillus wilburensis]MBN2888638.1 1-(5-phosphoribosyl)-5-[(5-phosphoribosylamino)methylideneamino]imidazole-4-carboxamide isomerase [Deltaproteobacteria bacterium]